MSVVGTSPHRLEDARLLTGHGRFVEDRIPSEALAMALVRSPYAHADIVSVDIDAAQSAPGVRLVLTGPDLKADGVKPMPCHTPQTSFDGTPFYAPDRHVLAVDRVRFAGEPVVAVIADTLAQALDAAELVDIDYQDQPHCVSAALSTDVAFELRFGDPERVAHAFEHAAYTVSVSGVVNNRLIVNPIETRTYLASYDTTRERYTLLTGSQGVHILQDWIAPTLDLDPSQLHIVTEDVGGSFAVKLMAYPEQTLALYAARRTAQPVAWVSTRGESHLSDAHGRDHVSAARLALDPEGRILALEAETRGALGAYASAVGPGTTGPGFAKVLGHNYHVPAMTLSVKGVYTNTAPTDAYRGAGKPEAIYLVERLMEKAAREVGPKLGLDRVAFKRRNLIPESAMPHRHGNGLIYDSGDFESALDAALEAADWTGFSARRAASEAKGLRRGIAVCPGLHATGGFPAERSRMALTPEGRITIKTGVQASGQGHETALAQIAATRLQIPIDRIDVIEGDTDLIHTGGGTGGSSSLPIAATTIDRATQALIEDGKQKAAEVLEASAGDIDYGDGAFSVIGTDRKITLPELADHLEQHDTPGCVGGADFEGQHQTIPHSAHVCEVGLDPETGRVTIAAYISADDLGVKVNPKIADGQIHGGVAQGIGQAWLEHTVYDPDSGQLLSGSLMDYALPRADDLPFFTQRDVSVPTEANPLGVKGVGELGTNTGLAPFVLAVYDALGLVDPKGLEMPLTPEKIWRAARNKG
ncbi:MAG: xanthine dehydrogenase family protein molybdopterin-binding subunit [Alphaproteobacteria bacterium]|nr:xanthine dehydrogenase family protein molybdopterin-binding subunit [Alphaproteobacteria bacterium]